MENSNPRVLTGIVTSNKADKTITVQIERKVKHPLYGKIIKRSTKVHAHDEENTAAIGDIVTVQECRPLSKSKTWMLVDANNEISVEPNKDNTAEESE
ncbi:30S ribosomal protein S17 [Gammaproteobacteria bacterium]|jgi:small subunit ribosomal protein S17|nr:30S ribosomal protein S17 [Gammaproteobacteria bacterium]MDA9011071.1 30S ribosomal protein S17 [Gammaproteobacteria bacterium]MDA9118432.1 30S ribosomal protein S17 [Gammaproteobacteria bacterium]MDC0409770.1 30S ribosomal protein S17 [Gammaproteobacteria bacterium]MDC0587822.1 30S ribosomal protein S17 [Gammaproteobacteria bacterium]|tara:strand:+ start:25 stop:318 length:294 start_codon:yes stop_codon:yes gene_type:complete